MLTTLIDFFWLSISDFLKFHIYPYYPKIKYIKEDQMHLDAATHWLLRSTEKVNLNGSSKAYRIINGWMPAYPETSGYIIKTFLNLHEFYQDEKYLDISKKIGDWEISIQLDNGGFAGRELGFLTAPVVFNTGQIILGLNELYKKTKEEKYLNTTIKAGYFLLECIDETGCFVKNLSNNIVHAYNVRVAWALIELGSLTKSSEFTEAGKKNVNWTISKQLENGYLLNNNFKPGQKALTHSIAYVLRGILESYFLTKEDKYMKAILKTTEKIISIYGIHKKLSSEIDEKWNNLSSHICLTGYAQLAIILLKLFKINLDSRYLNTALHLIDDVKMHQYIKNPNKDYYGGIKGSFPIYGKYAPLQFPNWATKFFIDSLLLKMEVLKQYENSAINELSFSR